MKHAGDYIDCPRCGGSGFVMRPPFYAHQMPKDEPFPCEECEGRGRFFIVPDDCLTLPFSISRSLSHGEISTTASRETQ